MVGSLRAFGGLAVAGPMLLLVWSGASCATSRPAQPKIPTPVQPVRVVTLPAYTEGVVFDRDGNGYCSHDKTVTRFTPGGKHETWAETGGPNGHKILGDGTHLLCDRS